MQSIDSRGGIDEDFSRQSPESCAKGIEERLAHLQLAGNQAPEQREKMDYAINPVSPIALERRTKDAIHRQRIRPELRRPIPEINIDPTRIDPHLVTLSNFDLHAAGQFSSLAVSLLSIGDCCRVLIASAQPDEGRTSVAINLAGALAHARKRVLLIETDLRNPAMLRMLGIKLQAGLEKILQTNLPLDYSIIRIMPAGFDVLGTSSQVENPVAMLTSPQLEDFLYVCHHEYDFILFDSPPLLVGNDALLLKRLVDKTMLIIRPGWTQSVQVAKALALFRKEDLCGVVLNRIQT